ncbi:MAG: transketolase [Bacilli bacterium]
MNKDKLAIEALRILSVEQITKANSGHPGIALGAAPILHTLYGKHLNISPKHHQWMNRDRFVMAAGHGSALLYALLYLADFGLDVDDLMQFRQFGSKTPGHPEVHITPGVDASTGPLGQGIAMAVGMAIAETYLGARFNRPDYPIIDHYTYALCGDGDLQEGVTQEAMSLAGHLGLNKLIVLFDSNDIQLDGKVGNANTENAKEKYQAMGWDYLFVNNGEDTEGISLALIQAKLNKKPTIIEIKTIIGHNSSVANTSKAHGSPLNIIETQKMRSEFGGEPFTVPNEVFEYYQKILVDPGKERYDQWQTMYNHYQKAYGKEAEQLESLYENDINDDWDRPFNYDEEYNKATRTTSGEILNFLQSIDLGLIGGSADLSSSTKVRGIEGDFSKVNRLGRNINFGVREHAMGAIANGLALHGGVRPFVSGFFVFSDYMKPAIRLSALMGLPVIYIFTHDSIAVGEDGPTHQPIEQLTQLRSTPHINVIRPADANETLVAWDVIMKTKDNPVALILTRQDIPNVTNKKLASHLKQGAYIISPERKKAEGLILASGSEIKLAIDAQAKLRTEGIDVRVISMPSFYLFEKESKQYQEQIIPSSLKARVALEMGDGVHYYKYLGNDGILMNISAFGQSAPASVLVPNYGFTVDEVVANFKKSFLKNQ